MRDFLRRILGGAPRPPGAQGRSEGDGPAGPGSLPFETLVVPGAEAIARHASLREAGRTAGFTPVILGSPREAALVAEANQFLDDAPEQILRRAAEIRPSDWLATREREDPEGFTAEVGSWPADPPPELRPTAHLDLGSQEPIPRVVIARLPAHEPWAIPAFLKYGGWNECPDAEVQVAFARDWHARFGAEIVAVTSSTVEYAVERPPGDREAALALAREHYLFCPDIVDQGTETLAALAATLLGGRHWFFWWD